MRNRLAKFMHRPAGGYGLTKWADDHAAFAIALLRLPGTPSKAEAASWMRMLATAQKARRLAARLKEIRGTP